jgi:glycosyltransferase involved in cell wall biosynthesis
MKILFIHTLYPPHIVGGAEVILRMLTEATRDRGHQVVVLATSCEKGLYWETISGVKVYRVGIENNYWPCGNHQFSKIRKVIWHVRDMYNKGMQKQVREIIREEKPDVVSCHNLSGWSISVWDAVREAGIPTIQVLHDLYFLCLKYTMFKDGRPCKGRCFECRIMRFLHRYKSQQPDAIVGVSAHVLNRVVEAGFFQKSLKAVVYNALIIPEISTNKGRKRDEFTLGFIGRISQGKGIEWLLEEFKKIGSKGIGLKIAGKGENSYVEVLKQLVRNEDQVDFLGFCKPEDFYPSIDVLVVPSIWEEAFPTVAIEACAYHIPVITSGQGGLKEIIQDGYNGLYCNISVPNSLSSAMQKIIDDRKLFERLKRNARESVRPFLDIDRWMCEYEDVYKRICRNK